MIKKKPVVFCLKLLLALLPFSVYLAVFIACEPYNYWGLKEARTGLWTTPLARAREYLRNPSENVILGDSRMNRFDLDYVEDLTGKRYVNLSTGGQALNQTYEFYYWACEKKPVANLVMDVSFYQLRSGGSYSSIEPALYIAEHPLDYIVTRDYVVESLALFAADLKKMALTLASRVNTQSFVDPNGGQSSFADSASPIPPNSEKYRQDLVNYAKYKILPPCLNYSIEQDLLYDVISIAQDMRNNGGEVLFVIPPVQESIFEFVIVPLGLERYIDLFKPVLADYGSICDMEWLNDFTVNQKNFSDGFHLSGDSVYSLFTKAIFTRESDFLRVIEYNPKFSEMLETLKTRSLPGTERIPSDTLENPIYSRAILDIYHENPKLMEKITDFERTSIIRDWAYTQIPWAPSIDKQLNVRAPNIQSEDLRRTAINILQLDYIKNVAGFYCGGTAYSLAAIYKLMGYDAFSLDLVVMDSTGQTVGSHVVTLVNISDESEDKWIIQDATFNVTYTDKAGESLCYFEIIALLGQRRDDVVRYISGTNKWKPVITFSQTIDESVNTAKGAPEIIRRTDGTIVNKFQYHLDFERNNEDFMLKFKKYFIRNGYREDIKYLFMYPYSIYNPEPANARMEEIREELMERVNSALTSTQ